MVSSINEKNTVSHSIDPWAADPTMAVAIGRLLLLFAILLINVDSTAASDAAAEKAARMKTTRQLKAILTELKIKFSKDADKEDLRELAVKHNVCQLPAMCLPCACLCCSGCSHTSRLPRVCQCRSG